MKKSFKFYLGAILLALSLNVTACDGFGKKDEIKQVYKLYKENGGTLTYEEWLETIKGPKGDQGDKGDTGVGIVSIVKTSTEGLVDTYTITYSDGTTSTFTVTNGEQGIQGIQGEIGPDGHTPVIRIGDNGNWFVDDVDTGIPAKGPQGEKGDTGKSAYDQYKETHPDYDKSEDEWLDDLLNGRLGNKETHTVTFETLGGSEIAPQTVLHGEKVVKPTDPIRAGFTFDGWTYQNEPWVFYGYVVTEDITLTAKWEYIDYTVTFVNDDGSELEKIEKVHYGDSVQYHGQIPTKVNVVDHYIYTFTGWDVDLSFIYGDTIATAQYSEQYAPYTAYFLDENDNVLYSTLVGEGETAVFQGDIPTKSETSNTQYQFSGWDEIERTQDTIKYKVSFESCTKGLVFNQNEVYQYVGITKDVEIPAYWNGFEITAISEKAFEGTNIDSVFIPDSVNLIQNHAFFKSRVKAVNGCNGLTTVDDYAFSQCEMLTSISFPNSMQAYNSNGELSICVFEYCYLLESFSIPSGFTELGTEYFYCCRNLKSIVIPDSITRICYAAFCYCDNLESVVLSKNLYEISMSSFSGCIKIESIEFPSSLKRIGIGAFSDTGLHFVTLPNDIDFIGESAFSANNRTVIFVPNEYKKKDWDVNWARGSQVVWGFTHSETINGYTYAFGNVGGDNYAYLVDLDDTVTNFEVPSTINGTQVVGINFSVFYLNVNITNIIIPNFVTSIPNVAFDGCKNLIHIQLPDSLLSIGDYAFNRCINLRYIYLPEGLLTLGKTVFMNCAKLEMIYIPSTLIITDNSFGTTTFQQAIFGMSEETWENMYFQSVLSLKGTRNKIFSKIISSIDVFRNDKLECYVDNNNDGYLLWCLDCTITTIDLQQELQNITIKTFRDYAFDHCRELVSIVIPEGPTSISIGCFNYCWSLENVVLPTSIESIGDNAFDTCWKLKNLIIPESVKTIGYQCFNDSYRIEYIVLPKNISIQRDNLLCGLSFYYNGTREDFKNFVVFEDSENFNIDDYNIYLYSENEPSETGKYWHYVNGVPTIWEIN